MENQQEPIRIVIEEEDLPLIPDKAGRKAPDLQTPARQAGQKASELAQKAWASEPRRKVTDSVRQGVATVASKSSKAVTTRVADSVEQQTREQVNALQTRLQEKDWKGEAKKGAAESLQWMSQKLALLAERLNTSKPERPEKQD